MPSGMRILPCWVIFTVSSSMFEGSFISWEIESAGWLRSRSVISIISAVMVNVAVFGFWRILGIDFIGRRGLI